MKQQIGFAKELVPLVRSGQKWATWRLNDKRGLAAGDICDFFNAQTNQKFAVAKLTRVATKRFKDMTAEDKEGHEPFANDEEMYKTFERFYGRPVGPDDMITIAWFELID